jgi:hypothetical protein
MFSLYMYSSDFPLGLEFEIIWLVRKDTGGDTWVGGQPPLCALGWDPESVLEMNMS